MAQEAVRRRLTGTGVGSTFRFVCHLELKPAQFEWTVEHPEDQDVVTRVVTTVRRDLCSREKMSTDASKARADVARGTGVKMQGLSAIAEAMLYCTQASFFSSVVTCELQPFLERRCFWSTAESMRGILNSWLGGAAIALYRCDWWCR